MIKYEQMPHYEHQPPMPDPQLYEALDRLGNVNSDEDVEIIREALLRKVETGYDALDDEYLDDEWRAVILDYLRNGRFLEFYLSADVLELHIEPPFPSVGDTDRRRGLPTGHNY